MHLSLIASPFLSNKPRVWSLRRPHRRCRAHRWYHLYPCRPSTHTAPLGGKTPQHHAQPRRSHRPRSNADLGLTNITRLVAFSEAIYFMWPELVRQRHSLGDEDCTTYYGTHFCPMFAEHTIHVAYSGSRKSCASLPFWCLPGTCTPHTCALPTHRVASSSSS